MVQSKKEIVESLKLDESKVELSMGMSHDYPVAIEMGSTMIRVGTSIFGARNYAKKI
jgi:uncharacterized pyridoxal phosphate-containing UPF0001 family protein